MFSFRSSAEHENKLAPGDRLYAIGDIHGRLDLLEALYQRIRADADSAPDGRRLVVHLGDYVDRGPDSQSVIDLVMAPPLPGFETVVLLGNHEELMRTFLERPLETGQVWMINGAGATMESYGVAPPRVIDEMVAARDALKRVLPPSHVAFLHALKPHHSEPPFYFAHAGVKPGVPLDRQDVQDLIWIREEFLDSTADHGAVVVHGHSIRPAPEVRRNRIGIDTGAYRTGKLTAAVLGRAAPRFLQT